MKPQRSGNSRQRLSAFLVGFAVLACALLGVTISAPASQYFRFFNLVYPGASETQPRGINNAGAIVGYPGFVWQNGAFTVFNGPDGSPAVPTGINSLNQIVGTDDSGGFLYSNGTFTTINVPGASGTEPNSINQSGMIVGQYFPQTGSLQGFIYSAGTYTTINFPGALSTGARGINDVGQIVGFYTDATGTNHAFIYSGGTFQTLFGSTCQSSVAYGINNLGQIVGYCDSRAYVYNYANHSYMFFGDPDGPALPFGINDSGRVTGQYGLDNGDINGFLAVPIQ